MRDFPATRRIRHGDELRPDDRNDLARVEVTEKVAPIAVVEGA